MYQENCVDSGGCYRKEISEISNLSNLNEAPCAIMADISVGCWSRQRLVINVSKLIKCSYTKIRYSIAYSFVFPQDQVQCSVQEAYVRNLLNQNLIYTLLTSNSNYILAEKLQNKSRIVPMYLSPNLLNAISFNQTNKRQVCIYASPKLAFSESAAFRIQPPIFSLPINVIILSLHLYICIFI